MRHEFESPVPAEPVWLNRWAPRSGEAVEAPHCIVESQAGGDDTADPADTDSAEADASFLKTISQGLSRPEKSLPPACLQDEAGADLMARADAGPDRYAAGREAALLARVSEEVATLVGPEARILLFGSAPAQVLDALLEALERPHPPEILSLDSEAPPAVGGPLAENRLGTCLGATVGNLAPAELADFLERARAILGRGWLLVGTDPNGDTESLLRAHADDGGLMAAFHLNVLHRLVRANGEAASGQAAPDGEEANAPLTPEDFRHEARVLLDPFRVETHLVAERAGSLRVGTETVDFAQGESVRTGCAYRYAPGIFQEMAADAGWEPVRCWLDPDGLFSLHLLRGEA
ncbi:L-histidine N(alpha)-methyltransferase [Methylobacterium oxalidis]|uniref:Histidine N-alpha-methyltransferase n=1 Tax=Methylobacterium oxalidis TaxID=944322 RepID=A0A512J1M8_9HYPH|nr:L-histidine N(alpha)-methyltransferase [Methylobacterium oxalidis]GEP03868.1 histidine N-alpha-methyltransferase [Methylobacterium oxalidis]GJE31257.1 Histidine N-alpha-methyltransferase [Methylobacterium oxalidis]GLS65274.1 histidine N-alpha-methyltransferase [Methylobacterium oxalidis]